MRVACLGGGPAGLYLAISLKRRQPGHEIVVVERNRPHDTFGWGVVLSDEILDNLDRNDPASAAARMRPAIATLAARKGDVAEGQCKRTCRGSRESLERNSWAIIVPPVGQGAYLFDRKSKEERFSGSSYTDA